MHADFCERQHRLTSRCSGPDWAFGGKMFQGKEYGALPFQLRGCRVDASWRLHGYLARLDRLIESRQRGYTPNNFRRNLADALVRNSLCRPCLLRSVRLGDEDGGR